MEPPPPRAPSDTPMRNPSGEASRARMTPPTYPYGYLFPRSGVTVTPDASVEEVPVAIHPAETDAVDVGHGFLGRTKERLVGAVDRHEHHVGGLRVDEALLVGPALAGADHETPRAAHVGTEERTADRGADRAGSAVGDEEHRQPDHQSADHGAGDGAESGPLGGVPGDAFGVGALALGAIDGMAEHHGGDLGVREADPFECASDRVRLVEIVGDGDQVVFLEFGVRCGTGHLAEMGRLAPGPLRHPDGPRLVALIGHLPSFLDHVTRSPSVLPR